MKHVITLELTEYSAEECARKSKAIRNRYQGDIALEAGARTMLRLSKEVLSMMEADEDEPSINRLCDSIMGSNVGTTRMELYPGEDRLELTHRAGAAGSIHVHASGFQFVSEKLPASPGGISVTGRYCAKDFTVTVGDRKVTVEDKTALFELHTTMNPASTVVRAGMIMVPFSMLKRTPRSPLLQSRHGAQGIVSAWLSTVLGDCMVMPSRRHNTSTLANDHQVLSPVVQLIAANRTIASDSTYRYWDRLQDTLGTYSMALGLQEPDSCMGVSHIDSVPFSAWGA